MKSSNNVRRKQLYKYVLTAILAGFAVIGSTFSIPILGARCAPLQHLINIVSGVLLGPWYSLLQAFLASSIRNITGLGTLLAFPGSMFGAFLAGLLYRKYKNIFLSAFGEIFGTSILGALVAFPIALLVLGNSAIAIYGFIVPFFISTFGGSIIAIIILFSMNRSGVIERLKKKI